jgi:hypothetical protein
MASIFRVEKISSARNQRASKLQAELGDRGATCSSETSYALRTYLGNGGIPLPFLTSTLDVGE